MRSQRGPGMLRVQTQLCDKLLRAGEFHRIAEPADELDLHGRVVPIAGGVEQVHLESNALIAEGRARAEVHHAAEGRITGFDADGVYAMWRQQLAARSDLEVDRRV